MRGSFDEASARNRIIGLLDAGYFREILRPAERVTSPHLPALDAPVAFDDGVVTGEGTLGGHPVMIAAQEGAFMGGAVGEVHGAKLTGLLERAIRLRPSAVLLLADCGGVRLHEANAGLIAISEIMRAVMNTRAAGIPVIALIGGKIGCFGGMGIVARLCDTIIISEEGRLGLSGPEVIETSCGVEEFDSADRALVWRTVGGKHRYLLGEAGVIVENDLSAFRDAAIKAIHQKSLSDENALEAEHKFLTDRLARFGEAEDSCDIWKLMGFPPQELPLLDNAAFIAVTGGKRA